MSHMIMQEEEASFGRLTVFSIQYLYILEILGQPAQFLFRDIYLEQVDQGSQGLKEVLP